MKRVRNWKVLAIAALSCVTVGVSQADEQRGPGEGSAAQVDASGVAPTRKESTALTFSVSPFIGHRFGGTFELADTDTHVDAGNHASYALALDVSTDRQASQYELFYSRESTSLGAQSPVPSDLVVEYLHIGGTAEFLDSHSHLRPYLIGSLGATRFDPARGITRRISRHPSVWACVHHSQSIWRRGSKRGVSSPFSARAARCSVARTRAGACAPFRPAARHSFRPTFWRGCRTRSDRGLRAPSSQRPVSLPMAAMGPAAAATR